MDYGEVGLDTSHSEETNDQWPKKYSYIWALIDSSFDIFRCDSVLEDWEEIFLGVSVSMSLHSLVILSL